MKALLQAIKTKIEGLSLSRLDGPFIGVAPQGEPFPFVSIFLITSSVNYTFNQTNRFEEYVIQFTVRGPNASAMADYGESLATAFDRSPPTSTANQNFYNCLIEMAPRVFPTNLKDGSGNQVFDCVQQHRFFVSTVK